MTDPYHEHVKYLEPNLLPCAKRSFEDFSPNFVGGGDRLAYFTDQWNHPTKSAKLRMRTPLQIERDRILYSNSMRVQTEKYHVLYKGEIRIVRNYTTHTLRTQQVSRSICRGLRLNADFVEAIALGSKVGALPFIHASKTAVSQWINDKISLLDKQSETPQAAKSHSMEQFHLDFGELVLPDWINSLQSSVLIQKVKTYMPWAAGERVDLSYTSGQQSYWQLCTNPYTVASVPCSYTPETMYGIWRHTRKTPISPTSFHHRCVIKGASSGTHEITSQNATYEAVVHQYADDITWIIENLNDANRAAILNDSTSVYDEALDSLGKGLDEGLLRPMNDRDAGGLYTYFINDFVQHSEEVFRLLDDGVIDRVALRDGRANAMIGLSDQAEVYLDQLEAFLRSNVFTEQRVANRFNMLQTLSTACMDLLYSSTSGLIEKKIKEIALRERWKSDETKHAIDLLTEDVHRIQVCVNVFADMGDQQVYSILGIQPW